MAEGLIPALEDLQIEQGKEVEELETRRKPQFARSVQELRSAHDISAKKEATLLVLPVVFRDDLQVSTTALNDLQRISLNDLSVRESYCGGYLILRTLETPYGDKGVTTVVEDHEGAGAIFVLYNATQDVYPNLKNILPVGTVFVLKEPTCTESKEGDCIVHCECPSDMLVVYAGQNLNGITDDISWKYTINDPLERLTKQRTARDWLYRGNIFCQEEKFMLAISCYYLALQKAEELENDEIFVQKVHSQLCWAYYGLGFFEIGLNFAKMALENDPRNKSALFVAGQCNFQLRKFENTERILDVYNTQYPDDGRCTELLTSAYSRLNEKWNGKFNILDMYSASRDHPGKPIDCADYVGPIEIVAIEGKGRGVVASEDVQPGTLLVVSKALVFKWKYDDSRETVLWQHIVVQLAQMIAKNPETYGPLIYSLNDGSNPVEGPIRLFCDTESKQEPIVEMQKLKNIVMNNAFGEDTDADNVQATLLASYFGKSGCGLFYIPSYFNHSCLPNASVHEYNDVLLIRSIQFIKAEEEICIPYISWALPFLTRELFCARREFQCYCQLCQQDRAAPPKKQSLRQEIFLKSEEINRMVTEKSVSILPRVYRDIAKLIERMNSTYDNPEKFPQKAAVCAMYVLRAKTYALEMPGYPAKPDDEIESHKLTLRYLGFESREMLEHVETSSNLIPPNAYLDENVLNAVAHLFAIYDLTRQPAYKARWLKILIALENIYSGGDYEMLKLKYDFLKGIDN